MLDFLRQIFLRKSLIRSFVLSDLSKSLTVAHLIWAKWANERWVNERIPSPDFIQRLYVTGMYWAGITCLFYISVTIRAAQCCNLSAIMSVIDQLLSCMYIYAIYLQLPSCIFMYNLYILLRFFINKCIQLLQSIQYFIHKYNWDSLRYIRGCRVCNVILLQIWGLKKYIITLAS